MLAINFNKTPDENQTNAQNAGLIDFWISFLCKNSHIKAHPNGHKINHNGQKNNHIIIHIIIMH